MKFKKITIETDGTSAGTKFIVDGEQVALIQRIDFSADVKSNYTTINVQVAKFKNGSLETKKLRVRDVKTEKFSMQDVVSTVPLSLERDA